MRSGPPRYVALTSLPIDSVGVVSLKKLRLGGTARSCVGGGQGGTALHEEWLLQNVFFGELVIPKVMSSPQK